MSAPPPKKNPGSAPVQHYSKYSVQNGQFLKTFAEIFEHLFTSQSGGLVSYSRRDGFFQDPSQGQNNQSIEILLAKGALQEAGYLRTRYVLKIKDSGENYGAYTSHSQQPPPPPPPPPPTIFTNLVQYYSFIKAVQTEAKNLLVSLVTDVRIAPKEKRKLYILASEQYHSSLCA